MSRTLEQLLAAAKERMTQMQDLTDGLTAIRGRATSGDGLVTAIVDGQGALVDLELAAGISALTPEQFEISLLEAAAAAAAESDGQRDTLIGAFNERVAE